MICRRFFTRKLNVIILITVIGTTIFRISTNSADSNRNYAQSKTANTRIRSTTNSTKHQPPCTKSWPSPKNWSQICRTHFGQQQLQSPPPDAYDNCRLYKQEGAQLGRVPYPRAFSTCSAPVFSRDAVTLVTQLTLDRLDALTETLSRWKGPASIALYLRSEDECLDLPSKLIPLYDTAKRKVETAERVNGYLNPSTGYISIHAVLKTGEFYPINYLRNLARNYSETDFHFLVDVDYIPSATLYEEINQQLPDIVNATTKAAVVVPCFEYCWKKRSEAIRRFKMKGSKDELLHQIKNHLICPARQNLHTHRRTNYSHWYKAKGPFRISVPLVGKYIKHLYFYEPFYIVPHTAPLFDPRLMGRSMDKIIHTNVLRSQGFSFWVLNAGFVLEKPHPSSEDLRKHLQFFYNCTRPFEHEYEARLKRMHVQKHNS